jgi:IS5 family transposase
MIDRISTAESFLDYCIDKRISNKSFLMDVDRVIDWKPIEKLLKKHYKKTQAADGRPAYPALPLFKMLLIQCWYNLSDPGLEEAVTDRLSFLRFTGFSFESSIPDETTICRFRNELTKKGLYKKLLGQINEQLEKQNILVKRGVIVDASLVTAALRPRKVVDIMPEDRREEEHKERPGHEVSYSADADAAWVKKGNEPHYGYKLHMATDAVEGFILGGHTTPANRADTVELERVVEDLNLPEETVVLADKGYSSRRNREMLHKKGFHDGIMERASRGFPLSQASKGRNRLISRLRYVVEQGFGTLKRRYQFERARYVGLLKTEMEFYLNAMAFNIRKAVAMLG